MQTRQARWGVGEKITLGAAALILIDLVVLPWHVYAGSWYTYWDDFETYTQTTGPSTTNGIQGSGAFLGVLAGLATIALIVRVVMSRTSPEALERHVPEVWRRRPVLELGLAGLLVAKLMLDPSSLGYGAIIAVMLGAAVLLGRYLSAQEVRGDLAVVRTVEASGAATEPPGAVAEDD